MPAKNDVEAQRIITEDVVAWLRRVGYNVKVSGMTQYIYIYISTYIYLYLSIYLYV